VPDKALPGRPVVWRADFFGAFANQDVELLQKGLARRVFERSKNFTGRPRRLAQWEKFYDVLVKEYGLHPKPAVIGLSRGGIYAMAWGTVIPIRRSPLISTTVSSIPRVGPVAKSRAAVARMDPLPPCLRIEIRRRR